MSILVFTNKNVTKNFLIQVSRLLACCLLATCYFTCFEYLMFWVFTFILRLLNSHLRQIKWQQLQIKYISSTEKASKKLVCQIHSILVDVSIIIILQISAYRRNWSIILHWSNIALRNRSCANVSLCKLFLTRTLFIKIPFRGKRHNALYVN